MAAPNSSATGEALSRLDNLEKHLMELSDEILPDMMLDGIGIHRAPQLVLDDNSVFFQPLKEGPRFEKAVKDAEAELNCWGFCPVKDEHDDRLDCALHTIDWFDNICEELIEDSHLYTPNHPKWNGAK